MNKRPPLTPGMRTYTIIWFGQLISTLGSSLSGFALGVWIYQETGSTTLFALSMFVWFLPTVLFAPFASVLADRYDRRVFSMRRMIAFSIIPLAYLATGPASEHIFTPLLAGSSPLAAALAKGFGLGPGRGSGLMFFLFGTLYLLLAQVILLDPHIRNVEHSLPYAVQSQPDS